MTTTPFVCAKSGEEFLPEEGGKCGICQRLLLHRYSYSKMFARQLAPVCVDCLRDIGDLAVKGKLPKPWP
jgi:hypothetical protein